MVIMATIINNKKFNPKEVEEETLKERGVCGGHGESH
jgi:hypothetical protein